MEQTIANATHFCNSNRQLISKYLMCHDSNMAEPSERVKKLQEIVNGYKSTAEFARRFDFDVTYIRQLLNGHRSFGEKSARKMGLAIANDPNLFERICDKDDITRLHILIVTPILRPTLIGSVYTKH